MDKHYAVLNTQLTAYETFFRRRLEVEREYADALRKLATRQSELDRKLDDEDRGPYTTFRQAWIDIRATVSGDARVHTNLAERLEGLVASLVLFKDEKERTRRRVREEREKSGKDYEEYKNGAVLRLRRAYERKVEEVQEREKEDVLRELEREKEDAAGTWPLESWSDAGETNRRDSSTSSRGGESGGSLSPPSSSNSTLPSNPVFISGTTSSSMTPTGSTSGGLSTGKANMFDRHVNAKVFDRHVGNFVRAVGSLAKGDGGAGLAGVARGIKTKTTTGKVKREAEQADRDYRESILRCETLLLQKERVMASSAASLRDYAFELSAILKTTFGEHIADLVTAGEARIAVAKKAKAVVVNIDPGQDAIDLSKRLRDTTPPEAPVYYVNAFVGECRNLLFGVSLTDYAAKHPRQLVPLVVQRCIAEVDKTGLAVEGIYRISAKLATVQQLVHRIEKDEVSFEFDAEEDPATIAGVLKLYLRQLPSPLFPFPTADRLAFSNEFAARPGEQQVALATLARRIKRLSTPHQATLKVLCEHLNRVVQHSNVNKMNATNLGLVFTPVVFGEDEGATLESAMHSAEDTILSLIIANVQFIFEGLPVDPSTPLNRSRAASLSQIEQAQRIASRSSLHLVSTSEDGSLMPRSAFVPYPRSASDTEVLSTPTPTPNLPNDSIYAAPSNPSTRPSTPSHSAQSSEHQLYSPSPPLSAAGGRHVS